MTGGPITARRRARSTRPPSPAATCITQADIDAGNVYNIALVTGTPPSGPNVTDSDDHNEPLPQKAELSIVKSGTWVDGDADGFADVGRGHQLHVQRDERGQRHPDQRHGHRHRRRRDRLRWTRPRLDVGETDTTTFTGVYYITQADIDAGHFFNTATADSTSPDPTATTRT